RGKNMPQGRYFSPQEIDRIKSLLSTTDLALKEIATRMNCAKSSIVSINRNFRIREYGGRRSHWACSPAQDTIDTNGKISYENGTRANAISLQPDGPPSWQIVDDNAEAA